MILFICNSPFDKGLFPFGKMHRPGAFITKNTVFFFVKIMLKFFKIKIRLFQAKLVNSTKTDTKIPNSKEK